MADAELQLTNVNNNETLSGVNKEETLLRNHAGQTSLLELREMLLDIQITVSNVLRKNTILANRLQNYEMQSNGRNVS